MPLNSRSAGHVTGLLIKPVAHQPMDARQSVDAIAHLGLNGDCHAQPLGPRQVLVVRQEALIELRASAWQVRANLVVAGLPGDALQSGSVLLIGERARIRVTHECEICSVLRQYLDRDTYRRLPGRRGALGVFLDSGPVRLGDTVKVDGDRWPSVPDRIGDRASWVIARIPFGRALTYDRLITLIGGKRAHFRVLPTYIRRASDAGLPGHRVLTSAKSVTPHIPGQADLLAREGVAIDADGKLGDVGALWDGANIYRRRS